jgi:exodeoxyribonuclease III
MTQRIITWNVNGLRSVFSKGLFEQVLKLAPDILCLQEIKTFPESVQQEYLNQLGDFTMIWHPAQKAGYSGVAIFTKLQPLDIQIGLGDPLIDREGRVIILRFFDFTLLNVYVPSGQRDQGRVKFKLAFYEKLLEMITNLQNRGEQIILGGDINTAHQEIDLRNPKTNQKTSGFLPEERAWIDRFISSDLIDIFRVLYPERVQYSWWTYISNARQRNVGWRLDYYLVSKGLLAKVKDVVIHEEIFGSDHCPVSILVD